MKEEILSIVAWFQIKKNRLKTKNLLAMLTNGKRFFHDAHFELLASVYNIFPKEIETYIKSCMRTKDKIILFFNEF